MKLSVCRQIVEMKKLYRVMRKHRLYKITKITIEQIRCLIKYEGHRYERY